jgi:hypothetical protein
MIYQINKTNNVLLTQKIKGLKKHNLGFVDYVDILAVRLTQSLSNHLLRKCFAFFNALLLIQASLIRKLTLKKPVTYVTGFVVRPGFEPGTSVL